MTKSKKNSLKLDMPASIRRNAGRLIILLVGVILGTLIVVGQQGEPMTKKQIPISDRIENAIKAKEPKFKLAGKLLRNNEKPKYVMLGWKSGEDFVSTNTYELASTEEAAEMLRKTLDAPRSVPVQTTKLTQLGDEAYTSTGDYSKEGHTNLLFRKGHYFVLMSASTEGLAKRFAKHLAAEMEK
jgi:hypothetical protein